MQLLLGFPWVLQASVKLLLPLLLLLLLLLLQQSARLLRRLESDLASSAQRHNETKRENMLLKQRICELQGATVKCRLTPYPSRVSELGFRV